MADLSSLDMANIYVLAGEWELLGELLQERGGLRNVLGFLCGSTTTSSTVCNASCTLFEF